MGFASYIEDIQKRLDDDLLHFKQALDVNSEPTANPWNVIAEHKRRLDSIYLKAQRLIQDIHGMLDLATNPALDVAVEIMRLRGEKAQLENNLRDAKTQMHVQQQAAEQREAALRQQLASETRARRESERKLQSYDARLETDPNAFAALLDHFGPAGGHNNRQGGHQPGKKRQP